MPVRQGCLGTAIISKDVLDVLDVGIARLRSNGGRCVISGDNEDTAFWLNGCVTSLSHSRQDVSS